MKETLPKQLSKLLKEDKNLKNIWDKLAPSHKAEYLKWIKQAKKNVVVNSRIEKTVKMLKQKSN